MSYSFCDLLGFPKFQCSRSLSKTEWSFADSETSKNKHTDMLICQRYPKPFYFSYSKTEMQNESHNIL